MSRRLNVWIMQTGEPLHIDKGSPRPMRAINLSNKLVEAGHNVVLWSAAFDHRSKVHRTKQYASHKVSDNLEIRLVPSVGYKKHIGFSRLFDHFELALRLKLLLCKEKVSPDIAFIGYPPIEVSAVLARWLKKRNVPMLLDVKDLWPSIFIEAFPKLLKPLARAVFLPYFFLAKRAMNDVTGILTMSHGYLDWCLTFASKPVSENNKIVRLTSSFDDIQPGEFEQAESWWKENGVDPSLPTVFFAGTYGHTTEFDDVYQAAQEVSGCQFVLCGDGPRLNKVKEKMQPLANVIFPGWINRAQMKSLATMSMGGIAPYKNIENYTLNVPNKIVDYLALGIPILCPLEGEVEALIKTHKIGFTYGGNLSLGDCINNLITNAHLRNVLSDNVKELYKAEFEFNRVYDDLVKHLEGMTKS